MWSSEIGGHACKIVHTAISHSSEKSSMNTGFRGVLPVYDIFGCASDFASNFRHLTPTTLNCGATELGGGGIIPFVKREKYKEQQEYRFLVRVWGYRPNKDRFYLKVSDGVRNMMTPVEDILR